MRDIRAATIKDAKRIYELFNSNLNLRGDNTTEYTKAEIIEYISSPLTHLFVYLLDKKIIASALVELWKKTKDVWLLVIVIDQKHQGEGVAKEMMDYIERLIKKERFDKIVCFVATTNAKMQKFLEKRRYRKGKKFFFYSKNLR